MKERIDVITKLSEELYNSSNGLHTVDLCKCDTWQMIIDDMLLQLEAIRCEIYEKQL